MGRRKKPNNYLTDVVRKERYIIEGIHEERITFASPRKADLVIDITRPKTRKHIPIFLATKQLRHRARVRQTPFRMQYTISYFYQVKHFSQKHGVRNPIDEFVEIINISWSAVDKTFNVGIKFIDNVRFVRMMHDFNKREKQRKRRVKNTTRTRGKKSPGKRRKKRPSSVGKNSP